MQWLLDPLLRNQGRTTALAIATIRVAATYPGRAIAVRDHHPRRADLVAYAIRDLVEADPLLRHVYRREDLMPRTGAPELVFDLTTPIQNWMPRDWYMPERRPAQIVDVPLERSLGPRARLMMPHVTDQQLEEILRDLHDGMAITPHTLDAVIYTAEAIPQVDQERQDTAAGQRSLWDYLEEDES